MPVDSLLTDVEPELNASAAPPVPFGPQMVPQILPDASVTSGA